MNVKISVHRSVPRPDLEHFVRKIPEKVLKDIDLPSSERVAEFSRYFMEHEGVMLFARNAENNEIVGTISAIRTQTYYISKEDLVSGVDPVPLSVMYQHEIIGAYIPEEYRRFGIYSKLRNALEWYAVENKISLYSVVRPHPESKKQSLNLLSRIFSVNRSEIEQNFDKFYDLLGNVSLSRKCVEEVRPSIGLTHPESVSVLHRWSKLVDEGNAVLLGYCIDSFSHLFLFRPNAEYIERLITEKNATQIFLDDGISREIK